MSWQSVTHFSKSASLLSCLHCELFLAVSYRPLRLRKGADLIKVLVVDDHDLVRMGITRMLNDVSGLTIVGEANSGESAIAQARALKPDVVLMDVRMPGIGGLEATRKLVQYDRSIKVIAVTA